MEITTTFDDDGATVALEGSLNTLTAGELEAELSTVFPRTGNVTLDFSNVDYLSSAGLRVLLVAHKRAAAAGGSLRIVGVIDEVREVLEITGFIDVFDVEQA